MANEMSEKRESPQKRLDALLQGLRANQMAMIEAAGKIVNKEVARLCYQAAADRAQFAKPLVALASEIKTHRENPGNTEVMYQLSRSLRAALSEGHPHNLLSYLVRVDDALLDLYKSAIAYADNAATRVLLREQYLSVRQTRASLEKLRDRYAPAGTFARRQDQPAPRAPEFTAVWSPEGFANMG